jgi:hypothetical protein
MIARRGFLKFVLGSAVVVGLPWKRFEWREPTFSEIVAETLRLRQKEVAESLMRSNVLFARLAERRSFDAGQRGSTVL